MNEINSRTFLPGDQILLKRGSVCVGNLLLKGSGSEGNSIVLSSYGEGNRPIVKTIEAVQAAIKIFNEEYWTIEHIETSGGSQYGIYVSGDISNRVLHNIKINDVFVHNVNGPPRWDSGLIVVAPNGYNLTFENVLIENSIVNNFENSTQGTAWWGIHVGFNPTYGDYNLHDRSRFVTVRNCNVQNTYGDSITFALVNDGLIENNYSKRSGLAPSGISYTPNAIWTWDSDNILIQFNEGTESYSHGVDGGIFDADHGSTNITFQYNYGHQAQGYCLGLFAKNGKPTSNIIFRYNLCIGNDRGGFGSGEVEFWSWNSGYFDGIQIYNNTFIRNSGNSNKPLVWGEHIDIGGSRPNLFFNNIFYSPSPRMIQFSAPFTLKNNIYWYSGSGNAQWIYVNTISNSLQEHQAKTGQDQGSIFADPLLPNIFYTGNKSGAAASFLPAIGSPALNNGIAALINMGERDFAGTSVPRDNIYDIGAIERISGLPQPTPTITPSPTPTNGGEARFENAVGLSVTGNRLERLSSGPWSGTANTVGKIEGDGWFSWKFNNVTTDGSVVSVKMFDGTNTVSVNRWIVALNRAWQSDVQSDVTQTFKIERVSGTVTVKQGEQVIWTSTPGFSTGAMQFFVNVNHEPSSEGEGINSAILSTRF